MSSPQTRTKFEHPVVTALTLIFFVSLVLVPAIMHHEPLRWQAAQAMLEYEEGNRDVAIESLQQVAAEIPSDGYVQTKLVSWLSQNGQAEKAIEHCNQQLTRSPESSGWLELKRESECEAGDFSAAWQTFEQLKSLRTQHVSRSADELNEQAYFRALAGDNLTTAATEIQLAVLKAGSHSGVPNFEMPLASQALVAAALLSRSAERQAIVLPPLNQRIKIAQRALGDRENVVVDSLATFSEESFPLRSSQEAALDQIRSEVEIHRRELAFLLVSRALLLEDLGRLNRCDLDRAQVVELGFEPQAVADLLPDDAVCHWLAMRAIAFLDTRGLVLTKMTWTDPEDSVAGTLTGRDAITDLNIAVAASDVINTLMQKKSEGSQETIARFKKTFAAVLHHRATANRKASNAEAVQADRAKIETLGFDPDGNLY